jgi:ribosome modulation factor
MAKWYADAARLSPLQRAKVRSQTFDGIANAMADQWSGVDA